MTLKEELEILRGEPIRVCSGDPLDIPCVETSDSVRLCKQPLVSVHMLTYNHEPYIRQAIEGVMMQKTDFDFELVIGEDCSTDKTREICFEYQKRYPDKIRVLWAHQNSYQHLHPAGGNGARTKARCRGEFIAFCEGDDYWTDPLKLQKQVDVLRSDPSVSIVSSAVNVVDGTSSIGRATLQRDRGRVDGMTMARRVLTSWEFGIITCAMMIRKGVLAATDTDFPFSGMMLRCGDTQLILSALKMGDAYLIPDVMACYRKHPDSATGTVERRYLVGRDGLIVRYAFARTFCDPRQVREAENFLYEYLFLNSPKYAGFSYLLAIFRHSPLSVKLSSPRWYLRRIPVLARLYRSLCNA